MQAAKKPNMEMFCGCNQVSVAQSSIVPHLTWACLQRDFVESVAHLTHMYTTACLHECSDR